MPADSDRLSLPPIASLSDNDLPPSLFSAIPRPPVPPPSLLPDAKATHHTALPAPSSGAGPTLPVTDTPSKATQARKGFSSSDLIDLARMALDLDVFSAKHGEKQKKWNELGAKLRLRGMNHSDASFQKKLEDLILWQDDPARATQSTRTLLKGSAEITIAALLDRLSEAKIEAAARTDEEHDRAVKKQREDQAGGEVIRLAAMQASRSRIDTAQETARASPSFPMRPGSAAAVKRKAGPLMPAALMPMTPRVKLKPVKLGSGIKAVKHEPLEHNIGGKAIKREPLELGQSRLSNIKTEALDSDIEFIGAAHGAGNVIELDSDGEIMNPAVLDSIFLTSCAAGSRVVPALDSLAKENIPASASSSRVRPRAESDAEDDTKPGPSRRTKRQRRSEPSFSSASDMRAFLEREAQERREHEARILEMSRAALMRAEDDERNHANFRGQFLDMLREHLSAKRSADE